MLYYLGKGTEFKKEDCKEYKKLDAALRAAAKDESLVVWDETGKVIGSLTDDVPRPPASCSVFYSAAYPVCFPP